MELGRIGFIGCGTIVSSLVKGLCKLSPPLQNKYVHPLVLSPRNESNTQTLQTSYPDLIRVETGNQEVLDCCDTVILGLTPQHAARVLEPLCFRSDHVVVSLMHGVSPDFITSLPREKPGVIVRVNPLPAAAHHRGISAISPPNEAVAELFGLLGKVYEVDSLEQFHALHAATTVMGPIYQMQAKVAAWLVEQEALEPALAQQYVGDMFVSITADACVHPKNYDYAKLVAEQTPGGLNEQNIKRLDRAGTFSAVSSALDDTLGTVIPPPSIT
jgi:pyrroline-5-carboxylate reductase